MPNALDDLARRIAALEAALPELSRASPLAYSSVDDGALTVTAEGRLRAIIGQQPDGTTAVNVVNGPVPPAPSPPTAAPALGGVRTAWDGRFADGSPSPLDLARVEVHAAPAPDYVPSPATLVTTIDTPQGGIVTVPTSVPVWVALVARSTSGQASAPSGTATAAPAPVVAEEVLAGIVGELALADGAVTAAKVAAGAIDAAALADAAVTATKLGEAAVQAAALAPGAVTGPAIAADSVTAREIAAGAVTAAELAAGSVSTAKLAAGAVTAGELAAGAVTTPKLAAGAVTADQVAAGAIAAGKIAADAVTGREIKALSITGDRLAANTITADQIAAGAVTAAALSADAITGKTIKGGTITGTAINGVTITGATLSTAASGNRVETTSVTQSGAAVGMLRLYSGSPQEQLPATISSVYDPDQNSSLLTLQSAMLTDPPAKGFATRSIVTWPQADIKLYSTPGAAVVDIDAGDTNVNGQLTARYGVDGLYLFARGSANGPVRPDLPYYSLHAGDYQEKHVRIGYNEIIACNGQDWADLLLNKQLAISQSAVTANVPIVAAGWQTWQSPITFKQGCSQLAGWRAVSVRRRPDGMVSLRGIVSVPGGVTGGTIATIDDPKLRPSAGEVFPASAGSNTDTNVFVYPNGNIDVQSASRNLAGWLSFGAIEWGTD
ncbi:hypothetical protein GCM10009759_03430 [Kitasatospora saccharophila]|uniref:Uncharacterized protein n=1 Tax=Kitasatospora saccharophila TaxID=407973 RepID=A0ABP5HT53_9ACTN